MDTDGTVKSFQKISDTQGTFTGVLDDSDRFGESVANMGDLDGDGVTDLVVGAFLDDDGGSGRGAAWVLFMDTDGTVKSHQKISDTQGSFTGVLDDNDRFGKSVANIGDLDGDGVTDLVVGAFLDDDGGASSNRGAVWVLFMDTDGTVKSDQKISDTQGGFTGVLDDNDRFGKSVANIGDLDSDSVSALLPTNTVDTVSVNDSDSVSGWFAANLVDTVSEKVSDSVSALLPTNTVDMESVNVIVSLNDLSCLSGPIKNSVHTAPLLVEPPSSSS